MAKRAQGTAADPSMAAVVSKGPGRPIPARFVRRPNKIPTMMGFPPSSEAALLICRATETSMSLPSRMMMVVRGKEMAPWKAMIRNSGREASSP